MLITEIYRDIDATELTFRFPHPGARDGASILITIGRRCSINQLKRGWIDQMYACAQARYQIMLESRNC